jgi:hypothetical protein
MSRIIDNLIAYRILSMLVTPFTDTTAFKLNIIDANGKNLKKTSTLKTSEERDAYSYLHRLVFNMKKILLKLPGGDSKIKNLIAGLWLVKEYYQSKDRTTSLMEEKLIRVLSKLEEGVILVEEEMEVKSFLQYISEEGEAPVGGPPANNTAGASVREPVVKKKDIKKYQKMTRRPAPVEMK